MCLMSCCKKRPDVVVWCFTPGIGWQDVVEVDIQPTENGINLVISSQSCSFIPTWIPLSPLLGLLLFWLPWADHGVNYDRILLIKKRLEGKVWENSQITETTIEKGCIVGFKQTIVVTIFFLIVSCATYFNYTQNDIYLLNLFVTIITSMLTLSTFITYAAALGRYLKTSKKPCNSKCLLGDVTKNRSSIKENLLEK
eukprot:c10731_g1_i2.p1 GENE.c10731_g1_i2~~c10731_g1_i2.p1  ORF type:complete len:197 (+),score=65.89 c10731_g1_i2:132-722(+)